LTREHESLQLKAAELRSPQRIEDLARTRLGMSAPSIDRVVVLVGGTIPQDDVTELKKQGVAEVFTPGAPTSEIVDFLQGHVPVSSS